jgi:GNAT superfamily N-acetyltransferase
MGRGAPQLNERSADPALRYRSAVRAAAARELGGELPLGTTVVGSPGREGSTLAVAYPLGDRTVVWCAPALAARLATLNRPEVLTGDDYVEAAELLGGSLVGRGHLRVLTGEPVSTTVHRYRPIELDRDEPADRELLAAFVAGCSDGDLDEAELDLDELDPAILVLLDEFGSIASYASGRPWALDTDFDDIAVLTHPAHRGQRLGAAVVAEFARRRQQSGRLLFYNHNIENHGSNRVAETVGFEVMTTVVAVGFDGTAAPR